MGQVPVVHQLERGGIRIANTFLGSSCLLTGYVVLTSAFLPRVIGMQMLIAGLPW